MFVASFLEGYECLLPAVFEGSKCLLQSFLSLENILASFVKGLKCLLQAFLGS